MVEHLSDDELRTLPRGGHDYRKLYAAYKLATEQRGAPTAILAKTIKGWTLGPEIEARNATHQIKKMTKAQLRALRDRLYLADEIPDDALEADLPPYYRPPEDSEAHQYLMARRQLLAGPVPSRIVRRRPPVAPRPRGVRRSAERVGEPGSVDHDGLRPPAPQPGARSRAGSPGGPHRARRGPDLRAGVDHRRGEDLRSRGPALRVGRRRPAAQLRGEQLRTAAAGGHHRGRSASAAFIALSTSYATWGRPMLPVFLFYSMFGFQRVGDLAWAARRHAGPGDPGGLHRRADHPAGRGAPAQRRPVTAAGLRQPGGDGVRRLRSPTRWPS